jgi:hypothetical protein
VRAPVGWIPVRILVTVEKFNDCLSLTIINNESYIINCEERTHGKWVNSMELHWFASLKEWEKIENEPKD